MTQREYEVGMLVEHPDVPEWGPGKVLAIDGRVLTVFFRDIPEQKRGDAVKRISLDHVRLRVAKSQSDPWLDNLPPAKNGRLPFPRPRWTLAQAVQAFLREFPLGFEDQRYKGDRKSGERMYKWYAHELFERTLGHGRGERLLQKGDVADVSARALGVVTAVNLLFPQEQMALRDGLKDPRAATRFFRTLFDVLGTARPEQVSFERYIDAVEALPVARGKTSPAKWPVLTILPFLAKPDTFMFLKPDVTKQAAECLAFSLQYDTRLNWRTYERLLAMSDLLMNELLKRPEKALHPRDWIDVQSFIWVTGRGSEYGGSK